MKYIGAVLLFVVNLLLICFTLHTMWGWFIVPLGAKAIGMAHAFGLSVFITYFTVRASKPFKSELMINTSFSDRIMKSIGSSAGALLVGYLTTLFM